ncbi:MAG: HAD-IIIA family hydrolase [Chitinophagaceae bacterium]|jgi:3-deoxy-D-manno-octulosonate 8-phosphate phosphatase (KDO 8-P phosphatase)|nr:HAD-IIIA family hydrolase [Chitinophagaceae bacterium]
MNVLELFQPITTFAFDVDGVLTDGSLLILPEGEFVRRMNIKDGYALQLAVKKGYHVVIISGSYSAAVEQRLNSLGIDDVFQKVDDKQQKLLEYMQHHNLKKEEVLFMGDDVPDYTAMKEAGLACCPIDAVSDIRHMAQYISLFRGGEGCVRDVIEKVLRLHKHWELGSGISSV